MNRCVVSLLLLALLASCGAQGGDEESGRELAEAAADSDGACVPACSGAECGLDGCGGVCGECISGTACMGRLCVKDHVRVPAGAFIRGCIPEDDPQCSETEQPQRLLELGEYRVDRLETSVAAYRSCVLAGACTEPGSGDYCNWGDAERVYHPVNCVTWFQADAYCRWAGKRLCSEAEWEKAARGIKGSRYPWGNVQPVCKVASFGGPTGPCGDTSTSEVGTHPDGDSPFGLLDASGNVWEWVADWYDGAWYQRSDPIAGPLFGEFRVVRGGSFASDAKELRAAYRWAQKPDQAAVGLGIRCCQ